MGMRRADKEITDARELDRVLDEAQVLHLGMIDGDKPYVVPVNFAREDDCLWVHGAPEGRKIRCLRDRPDVCIEVERLIRIAGGESACGDWTSHYESVIGFGTGEIVEDEALRLAGLRAVMLKYSGRSDWSFSPEVLAKTVVVRIRLQLLTGKRSPASR